MARRGRYRASETGSTRPCRGSPASRRVTRSSDRDVCNLRVRTEAAGPRLGVAGRCRRGFASSPHLHTAGLGPPSGVAAATDIRLDSYLAIPSPGICVRVASRPKEPGIRRMSADGSNGRTECRLLCPGIPTRWRLVALTPDQYANPAEMGRRRTDCSLPTVAAGTRTSRDRWFSRRGRVV